MNLQTNNLSQPAPMTQAKPRSRLAITAFTLGLLGIIFSIFTSIPAIVIGHIALQRIRNSPMGDRGRGLAIAGLVLGYGFTLFTGVILAELVLTGELNPNRPSEAFAAKMLTATINQESRGNVTLLSFKKTNGLSMNENGVTVYIMDFTAEIQSRSEGTFVGSNIFRANYFRVERDITGQFEVKNGTKIMVSGRLRFTKMESGWEGSFLDNPTFTKLD